jgi:branched-chain amino acid transport system ATP-binding protein
MLELENIVVNYGGIRALRNVSLKVSQGSIVSLLGANGAGKSTTIRAVSGLVPLVSGDIFFQGKSIKGLPVHTIQRLGLVHIPEGRKIFSNLSVRENLILGAYNSNDKQNIQKNMDRLLSRFPVLKARLNQLGGTLSGGEQQMLAISRALMSSPKLLMMDEPSLGLAPLIVNDVFKIISEIRAEGVSIFLVEQNAHAALKIADYAVLLENGRVVLSGESSELLENPAVKKAYLGEMN